MLNQEHLFISLLVVLGVMAVVGLRLNVWVFRRLERKHTEAYASIGRPSLIVRNNLENTWLFMRFMGKRAYASLDDPLLTRVCDFSRRLFVVYLIFFILLTCWIIHPWRSGK